jgi:hypothetical protein
MTGVWESGRPIYARLPGENSGYTKDEDFDGYDPVSDLPIARWLTEFWDEFLVSTQGKAANLYTTHLDPVTADAANLDWLAQLCGFTGDYWNSTWHEYFKRSLIANSFNFIWPNKGSELLFEWLFDLFNYNAKIFRLGDFLADISAADDTLGGDPLTYYIVVTLEYLRESEEWAQLELLNRIYGPVYHDSRVCYNAFYADFSVVDDPVFDGEFGDSPELDDIVVTPTTFDTILTIVTTGTTVSGATMSFNASSGDVLRFNAQSLSSGSTLPATSVFKIGGTAVGQADYPELYLGQAFSVTISSTTYTGVFASGDITLA